jgi:hypothetical protein
VLQSAGRILSKAGVLLLSGGILAGLVVYSQRAQRTVATEASATVPTSTPPPARPEQASPAASQPHPRPSNAETLSPSQREVRLLPSTKADPHLAKMLAIEAAQKAGVFRVVPRVDPAPVSPASDMK